MAAETYASPPTVVSHIADELARLILSGHEGFGPGARLRIQMLSGMFGASPTPIKEALRELSGQGLVAINPRRGAMVASLSARDFDEITTLRVELELLALRLAIKSGFQDWILPDLRAVVDQQHEVLAAGDPSAYITLDLRFHGLIAHASHNLHLISTYADLTRRAAIRGAYLVETPEAMAESLREHVEILACLERADLDTAGRLLSDQAERARTRSGFQEPPSQKKGAGVAVK